MLWVYLSKSIFALEIKLDEFLTRYKGKKILHLKRVDFETAKSHLTQFSLFEEYSYFIFEDYIGSFEELTNLFEQVLISSYVLITKKTNNTVFLSSELVEQLVDKNYWLFEPSNITKEKYFIKLLEKLEIKLPRNLTEIIKKEALSSIIQLKGVLTQLKLVEESDKKITEELVRDLIESNNVEPKLKNKSLFLEWYLSGKIKFWVLFLYSFKSKKSNSSEKLFEFLKNFAGSLNLHFWNEKNNSETQEFIRKLSYNFLIFMEKEIFKIKSNLATGVIYFFWKNRPLNKLNLVI